MIEFAIEVLNFSRPILDLEDTICLCAIAKRPDKSTFMKLGKYSRLIDVYNWKKTH